VTLAHYRKLINKEQEKKYLENLRQLPGSIQQALNLEPQIKEWAKLFAHKHHALFLGRGIHYPIAMEGALKLKEISYIHAEAYPAGELKHGPLAFIDEEMPVVFLVNNISSHEKTLSNVQEVAARKGQVIAIERHGDTQIKKLSRHVIEVPDTEDCLSPILASIPLQLLSYYVAIERGCNVDQPRNLAKSVTVE